MRIDPIKYKTIKDPDSINHYIVMNMADKTARRVLQKGHWIYLRKTERAEQIGGIYLPDLSRDDTQVCEVIAIGDRCHMYRPPQKKFKDLVDFSRNGDIRVNTGDLVIVPETQPEFITRSPYCDDEFMIDCALIKAVVE